jgi:NADPH-dependent 2,4-dienoyl-CoA reductase/sulfur reductase-like enzyme/rhodanese-related sulfurtransferase
MEKHLVIIGGVAAGTKAAAKARREDPDAKISLYTDEKYISYSACGMPYYIENLFDSSDRLIVRTKEEFKEKENIDIYTEHKALQILPDSKEVEIHDLINGKIFKVNYSKLLIATGAYPIKPPIEGMELKNVFTLRSITDGIAIKKALSDVKKAVIVGAGYIGFEMLEAFIAQGISTTIVELSPQILPALDEDLAFQVQKYIEDEIAPKVEAGIEIILKDGLKLIIGDENGRVKHIKTNSGRVIETDLVLISVGVKPNVELAKNAGIEIGSTGAIKVNSRMQTNIEDIYAAGDCAEQFNTVSNTPMWVPLGSTANKQGRIAAINMTGGHAEFKGVLGSAVTRIFDYTVSITGLGEKNAHRYGIDFETAIIPHKDRAGYMPEAEKIVIKMLAEKGTGRIIGVQAIGKGDADKRVNIGATAISAGMTIDEFVDTDLTYAPPYSPSIDPILTAAQVLQGKLRKKTGAISSRELEKYLKQHKACCLVDARGFDDNKMKVYCLQNGSENIEKEDFEQFLKETERKVVVYCEEGIESHITAQKLKEKGFKDVKFIDGGLECCTCKKLSELSEK